MKWLYKCRSSVVIQNKLKEVLERNYLLKYLK